MTHAVFRLTLLLALTLVVASDWSGCPEETWVRHGEHCYWFADAVGTVRWPEAVHLCYSVKPGAILASPRTAKQDSFIQNITTGSYVWLGLVRFEDGNWYSGDWGDVTYTNWGTSPTEGHNCSRKDRLQNGRWHSTTCLYDVNQQNPRENHQQSRLLNIATAASPTALRAPQLPSSRQNYIMTHAVFRLTLLLALTLVVASDWSGCPEETWVRHGEHCYWFAEGVGNVGWPEAVHLCYSVKPGAILASPRTAKQDSFIQNMTTGSYVWLGLTRFEDGNWYWGDWGDVTYTNWATSPADGYNCSRKYRNSNGVWYSTPCLTGTNQVLCQFPANDCTPDTEQTGTK